MGHGRNGKALAELRQKKREDKQRREAIEVLEKEIPYFKKKLELKEKDFELQKKIQDIILKKHVKLRADYEYENDLDYINYTQLRQQVMNELLFLDKEHEIDMMKDKIKEMEEQLEELKQQVKFIEDN